jgi:uncharacterized protein (UPF0333 family)
MDLIEFEIVFLFLIIRVFIGILGAPYLILNTSE